MASERRHASARPISGRLRLGGPPRGVPGAAIGRRRDTPLEHPIGQSADPLSAIRVLVSVLSLCVVRRAAEELVPLSQRAVYSTATLSEKEAEGGGEDKKKKGNLLALPEILLGLVRATGSNSDFL